MADLRRVWVELTINHPGLPQAKRTVYVNFITGNSDEASIRRAKWTVISEFQHLDITPEDIEFKGLASEPYESPRRA